MATPEEIAAKLAEHNSRIKNAEDKIRELDDKTDRIENLTLSVQELALSVKQMAKDQADYREQQNKIADKLLEIEKRPNKDKADRLDRIAQFIFTTIGGIVIGWIMYMCFGM